MRTGRRVLIDGHDPRARLSAIFDSKRGL